MKLLYLASTVSVLKQQVLKAVTMHYPFKIFTDILHEITSLDKSSVNAYRINLLVAVSSDEVSDDADDWDESSDDKELLRLRRGFAAGILLCSGTGS